MRAHLLVAAMAVASFSTAADDKPTKPEDKLTRVTYRVTGLFSRDREKDLRTGFEDLTGITLVGVDFDEAEITVEFVPSKAFPGSKPDQLVEQLNNRVRSATHHTFGVKPRRTLAKDKLQEVVIPVAGLDCKACCLAAYEIVAGVDGVYQATASFKDGRITARIDPEKTSRATLEETLRKRDVQVVKP